MDFVLYWIHDGEFEFEKYNYPYVYHIDSVSEVIWDIGRKVYNQVMDTKETWIPIQELPNNKREILNIMIKESEVE